MTLIEDIKGHPDFRPENFYPKHLPNLKIDAKDQGKTNCPFHNDKNPSFTVDLNSSSPHYGRWRCWSSCDESGDQLDFAAKLAGCAFNDTDWLKSIARDLGLTRRASRKSKAPADSGDHFGLKQFAEQKQLTIESLENIYANEINTGSGWEVRIFMFDATGKKIGLRRRLSKGKPKVNKGGKLGLFLPKNLDKKAGRLMFVEGETDLCAALILGFTFAVGLPGAGKCTDMVVDLCQGMKVEAIIIGDNDPPDAKSGRRPGQEAAKKLVQAFNKAKVKVKMWIPPEEGQDLRDWMLAGGTKDQLLSVIDQIPPSKVDEYIPESFEAVDAGSEPDPLHVARDFLYMEKEKDGIIQVRFWRDEFFEFNGNTWLPIERNQILSELWQFAQKFYIRGGSTRGKINNVFDGLRSEVILRSEMEMPFWIANDNLNKGSDIDNGQYIATKNGLFSTTKSELMETDPLFFNRNTLPVNYNENADCPRWKRFLEQIFEGDELRANILQEFFGYCFVPDNRFQRFLLMQGEGSNGKSQIIEVVRLLVGPENISAVPLEQFGDRFGLLPTVGRMLNICSDVSELDKASEGYIKSFTSGDLMTIDRKHINPLNMIPKTKLWLSCNNLPRFRDRSEGIWRRMVLLPFNLIIPLQQRITDLGRKMFEQESSGILNWSLEGYRRIMETGTFAESKIATTAKADYQIDSNPARAYLLENLGVYIGDKVARKKVYRSYMEWSKNNGFRNLNAAHFGREVKKVFQVVSKTTMVDPETQFQVGAYMNIQFKEYIDIDDPPQATEGFNEWS